MSRTSSILNSTRSSQEIDKHRRSHKRSYHSDIQLTRSDDGASQRVGKYEKQAAHQRRSWNDQTVVTSSYQPHCMWNYQANETDRAAHRDRCARQQRRCKIDDELDAPCFNSESPRVFFPDHQQVQTASVD